MNIKQFIEFLQTLPQDATVQVLSHHSGSGYFDQGGNCYVEDFSNNPTWGNNQAISKGENYIYAEHYEFTTDNSGQTYLQLGVMGK